MAKKEDSKIAYIASRNEEGGYAERGLCFLGEQGRAFSNIKVYQYSRVMSIFSLPYTLLDRFQQSFIDSSLSLGVA